MCAQLQGLSIIARRKQPQYMHAFLSASLEIASGAADEAADAAALSHAASRTIHARVDEVAKQRRQAAEAAAAKARVNSQGEGAPLLCILPCSCAAIQ